MFWVTFYQELWRKAYSSTLLGHNCSIVRIPLYVDDVVSFMRHHEKFGMCERATFIQFQCVDAKGRHCLVAWTKVWPRAWWLGILDVQHISWALRMRWPWFQKTEANRPCAIFSIKLHHELSFLWLWLHKWEMVHTPFYVEVDGYMSKKAQTLLLIISMFWCLS